MTDTVIRIISVAVYGNIFGTVVAGAIYSQNYEGLRFNLIVATVVLCALVDTLRIKL